MNFKLEVLVNGRWDIVPCRVRKQFSPHFFGCICVRNVINMIARIRVSGMGCYTSKCEKSQNHCTLMYKCTYSTWQLSSIDKEILFNAYKLTIPLSCELCEPTSAYGALLRSYLRPNWSDPVPGNIAEQKNQNDHQKHEGEMILAILWNKTLKGLVHEI